MRFSCNQRVLAQALSIVSKASSNRTTIPILKNILLEAKEDGKIILSASNLDLSIIKETDAIVEEPGTVTVNAKLFEDIIRKLPNDNINISVLDTGNVLIKTLNSEFTVVGKESDEFPNISETEEDSEELLFDKGMFSDMIRKTSFCASQDEKKGIIVGVLLELEENSFNMVSLDGFRMAIAREKMTNAQNRKIVIEAKNLNEINKILQESSEEGDIQVFLGKKRAVLVFDKTRIVTRLLEGEFINYRDVLPRDKRVEVVIDTEILKGSLERASLLAKEGRNNLVKFSIENDLMTITSNSEEGNVKEELIVAGRTSENLEIGFNSKYILDALKAIDDSSVLLEMNTSVNPCMIKPVDNNSFEYLILPVRIANH